MCWSEMEGWLVNARPCEAARHFDFLDCETETSKCFEFERETFRHLKLEPHILLRAVRMS